MAVPHWSDRVRSVWLFLSQYQKLLVEVQPSAVNDAECFAYCVGDAQSCNITFRSSRTKSWRCKHASEWGGGTNGYRDRNCGISSYLTARNEIILLSRNWHNQKISLHLWFTWSDFVLKWSEMSYVEVPGDKSTMYCTLGWPNTEGTWLYCDYFICCVSCTVVVLTCFVMC